MNRRALLAAGVLAPLLNSCGGPSFSYNYRFKIVVRVGDQLHEGSSVIGVVKTVHPDGVCYARCWYGEVSAEAPAVSLGERGYLFGLLGHNGWAHPPELGGNPIVYLGYLPIRVIGRRFPAEYASWRADEERSFPELFARVRTVREAVELVPDEYPPFVRFRDLRDPETVEFVDGQDMASVFGSGVAIERCSVQLTDERPSREIEALLPWLRELKRRQGGGALGVRLVPDTSSNDSRHGAVSVRSLTYEHFQRGSS